MNFSLTEGQQLSQRVVCGGAMRQDIPMFVGHRCFNVFVFLHAQGGLDGLLGHLCIWDEEQRYV